MCKTPVCHAISCDLLFFWPVTFDNPVNKHLLNPDRWFDLESQGIFFQIPSASRHPYQLVVTNPPAQETCRHLKLSCQCTMAATAHVRRANNGVGPGLFVDTAAAMSTRTVILPFCPIHWRHAMLCRKHRHLTCFCVCVRLCGLPIL